MTMNSRKSTGFSTVLSSMLLIVLSGCASFRTRTPLRLEMDIDSQEYVGIHRGIVHQGSIPFTLTNTTSNPISRSGCGISPPGFEKLIDGKWVSEFSRVVLPCLTKPDFYIAPGKSWSGEADYYAFD